MGTLNLTGLRKSVDELAVSVYSATGQNIKSCYQCGECSGGCPVSFTASVTPRQVMRLLQLGLLDEALRSDTIWVCAGCSTCSARCPRNIDLAAIMDYLREEAVKRGITPDSRTQSDIRVFHNIFLDVIRRAGRMYEVGLIGFYNLRSGHLFHDMNLVPALLQKRKLKFLPHVIKGHDKVAEIYERVKAKEGHTNG